jgi:hypothetical protein
MLQSNQPFPFSPPTRSNVFEFDGFRVGGVCNIQRDTGMRFIMEQKRTNPEAFKAILRSRLIAILSKRLPQQIPERYTVSSRLPILGHKELIQVGFLTAAYLLWFRELGYSWALQHHLEPIREQIRNPTRQVLPRKFSEYREDDRFDTPWIGIGEVAGELALLAGIANNIVFLPPADRPHFYEALPDDFQDLGLALPRPLQFFNNGHRFGSPVGVLFGTRAVVVPVSFNGGPLSASSSMSRLRAVLFGFFIPSTTTYKRGRSDHQM